MDRTRVEEVAAAAGVTPAVCGGHARDGLRRPVQVGKLGRLVTVGGHYAGGIRPGTEFVSVRPGLWVPETPHTSRDLLILVEQSTEPVAPSDGVRLARRPLGEWS